MAASQPALQYAVQTDADLENKLCEKGLKGKTYLICAACRQARDLNVTCACLPPVLEVYSEWCGPCKSVLPTLKRIKLDKDDESTLQFLTVCSIKRLFLSGMSRRILHQPSGLAGCR